MSASSAPRTAADKTMNGRKVALDAASTPGTLNELELLREQVANTQMKLKVTLTRYEELYRYSEEISKSFEQQIRALNDKVLGLEAGAQSATQERQSEAAAFSAKIGEFQRTIEAKHEEIRSLRAREEALLNNSFKLGRVISQNIQSLEDLSGFIESFLRQFDFSEADSLAPKGAKIMLEQLRGEIDSLKTVRNHLSSQDK